MIKKIFALSALVFSAHASASELSIKPEAIYSTSQLKFGNEKLTLPDGTASASDLANSRFVKGYGGALNLEYAIDDRWRVGGGAGYVSYNEQHGSNQPNFHDLFGKAQVSYDFLKLGDLSTYALAGASYHKIDLNTELSDEVKMNPGQVQVWNWDAALGARLKATDNVSLGLEYRVTNTFDSDRMKVKYSIGDATAKSDVNKVRLNTNEVLTSLTYAF